MDDPSGPGPWTTSWTTPHFKRQLTKNEVSARMFKLQNFGFAGRRVIDLKYVYSSNAGICGADFPDSSDR